MTGTPPVRRKRSSLLPVSLGLQAGAYGLLALGDGIDRFLGDGGGNGWIDLLLGVAVAIFLGAAAAGLFTRQPWGPGVVVPGLALGVLFCFGMVMQAFKGAGGGVFLRIILLLITVLLLLQVVTSRRERGRDLRDVPPRPHDPAGGGA